MLCLSAALPRQASVLLMAQGINEHFTSGLVALETGDYEAAIRDFSLALRADSTDPDLYLYLSTSLLRSGQPDEAQRIALLGSDRFRGHIPLTFSVVDAMAATDPAAARTWLMQTEQELTDEQLRLYNIDRSSLRVYRALLSRLAGDRHSQAGLYADAAREYRRAIELAPDSSAWRTSLAYVLFLDGQYDEVIGMRDKLPGSDPFAENITAYALMARGRTDEAIPKLKRLYRQHPENYSAGLTYGQALASTGQNEQALAVFRELLDRFPHERDVYTAILEHYNRAASRSDLIDILERMVIAFPADEEAMLQLALHYDAAARPLEGIEVLKKLVQSGSDPVFYQRMTAFMYIRNEMEEDGFALLEQAAREYPARGEALLDMGLYFMENEQYSRAIAPFQEYTERFPDDISGWSWLGRAQAKDGQSPAGSWEHALSLEAPYAGIYSHRVRNLVDSGSVDEAAILAIEGLTRATTEIDRLRQVAEVEGYSSLQGDLMSQASRLHIIDSEFRWHEDALTELAALINRVFRYDTAIAIFSEYRQRMPVSVYPYRFRTNLYIEHERYDEAGADLHSAIRLKPGDQQSLAQLGDLAQRRGEISEALLWYERAFGVEPTPALYRRLIELHRQAGSLNDLADRWLSLYRTDVRRDPVLREFLIEALHKSDRVDEARSISVQ